MSTIYNVHCFSFSIEEHKEVVTNKVHLQDRFFYIHWAYCKVFAFYNFDSFFFHRSCQHFWMESFLFFETFS